MEATTSPTLYVDGVPTWTDFSNIPSTTSNCTWYPYYPYYDNSKVTELEARIEELEEMIELLEDKTGYEVIENPRFKVVKSK